MEESSRKSVFMRPMTIAEMMPNLGGLLPKSEMLKLTAKKAGKNCKIQPHTTSKDFKPRATMTMAQLRAELQALRPKPSPMRPHPSASAMKRWNTSTKCEKKRVSQMGNASSKKLTARKILNFQPVSKPMNNIPRQTMRPTFLTPKEIKQDKKINKILKHLDAKSSVRISGICNIQQTPLDTGAAAKNYIDNKENIPKKTRSDMDESFRQLTGKTKTPLRTDNGPSRKSIAVYKPLMKQNIIKSNTPGNIHKTELANTFSPKTTQVNELFKQLQCKQKPQLDPSPTYSHANSELSFLEQEKVIYNETVNRIDPVTEHSPIVSTPFRKYRNVEEYNASNELDNTLVSCNVTLVDGSSALKPQDKTERDISSLCDLMNKAQFTQSEKQTDRAELIKIKNELEIENKVILESLKRNELMLESIDKLLNRIIPKSPQNATVIRRISPTPKKTLPWRTEDVKTCQPRIDYVLHMRRTKSPSYTIPKKSPCLRKRVLCKSVPHLNTISDFGSKSAAMTMYMQMKEQCGFLMTPLASKTLPHHVTGTPAITSLKLQSQLEQLYGETP